MITNFKFKIIIFVLLILLSSSTYILIKKERSLQNKIYPHVIVNNVDFGSYSKSKVVDYFKKINGHFTSASIRVFYKDSQIATFSGQQLKIGYDPQGIADRAYLIGRSSHIPSRIYQKFATILNWQKFRFDFPLAYDESAIKDFLDSTKEKYNIPAKNALFEFTDGRVVSFRQEQNGVQIDEEGFMNDFNTAVKSLAKGSKTLKLTLLSLEIEPEITLAKSNSFGIEELIGVGKSDFSHSIPERIHNIILASSKFHGVLIPKGDIFSFNDVVGDISSLTGYKPAYIIKAGKTVLGDGGGVCQVSTTLFRTALNTGLSIIERTAHAYRVSYYENDSKPGFDATVFAPTVDLKFKNDTPASILIQTEIDNENNFLHFRFYGKKDERKIEISPVTVYDVVPPLPEIRQDDPTLKKGVVKQVDFPAWGAKAIFSYKVTYDKKETYEKKFLSIYRPWQAVYLVGTAD